MLCLLVRAEGADLSGLLALRGEGILDGDMPPSVEELGLWAK